MKKSDIKGNLVKLENSQASRCFMLATSKEAEFKLKTIREASPEKKPVRILFVKDFLKLTRDQILNILPNH